MRQDRRLNYRSLLDNAANKDLAQIAVLRKEPMTEVLYRVEQWLDSILAAKEQAKRRPLLNTHGRAGRH